MCWLVRTSRDLGGRPPLASRCISLSWLFFHGGNTNGPGLACQMSLADLAFKVAFAAIILYIFRSHVPTDVGSNRTHVPMRNDGILPAFACLKIVILETVKMLASSSAVKARPIRSLLSGSDIVSPELFWGLHECIYLLCGFTCGNCRILL